MTTRADHPSDPSDHFSDRAALYARHRPEYPSDVARAVAAAAPARGRIWEPGCGSGQLTRTLAGVFGTVLASDPSAEQLARAPRLEGVRYVRERAETSALASASIDAVAVGQAAHWLDLEAFYREAARVGRPGSVLALVSYGTPEVEGDPGPVVRTFHHGTLEAFWPEARHHVDEGYADLPFPFERIPTPAIAMDRSWTVDEFLGYADSWSGVRRLKKAMGDRPFEGFAAELRGTWGPGARRVRWPVTVLMGHLPGEDLGTPP